MLLRVLFPLLPALLIYRCCYPSQGAKSMHVTDYGKSEKPMNRGAALGHSGGSNAYTTSIPCEWISMLTNRP